jgi:DNA-binding transcriptional regulator GbsR (MarR family)
MSKPGAQLPEMQELSEQIGEFIHYWGFKRVHGRIWTHLFLSDKPLDSADMVRQMKISKALVSISVHELLEYEVITECGKSERNTQLYTVNPDILQVILNVLRGREKRLLNRVTAAHEALDKVSSQDKIDNQISQDRLVQLKKLVSDASDALDGLISLRSVNFADFKQSFTLEEMLGCAIGAGSGSGSGSGSGGKAVAEHEISSARADNGEIQLIGRPLIPKS